MYAHFLDYYWKGGKPYGREAADASNTPASYKIIADPYYKRFTIEKYRFKAFDKIIYDSALLDFRSLKEKDQSQWWREILKEEKVSSRCLLRNQDDRAILFESLTFEGAMCRKCETLSIHGIPLAHHLMHYRKLNDTFDGVVLYDSERRPVMMKVYECDDETGEFTQLLSEEWNMQILPALLIPFTDSPFLHKVSY